MRKPYVPLSYQPMLTRSFNVRYFEDPEDSRGTNNQGGGNQGGNAGGNAQNNGNQGNQNNGNQGGNQPDLAQVLANLMARHGSMDTVGQILLTENRDYRERLRQMEGRVPAEGSVILTGDDAQHWQAYRALGAPTEVKDSINELTTLRRDKAIAEAAEAAGFKAKVLGQLPKVAQLTFTVKEETDNGQTVKRAYVKDGDTEELLATYAERVWEEFLPVLSADTNPAQRAQGAAMVRQHVGGKAPNTDPIATHNQKVGYALPSQKKD